MVTPSIRIRRTLPAGFTLVELLIVISIVGILAAISAGAFFRVRAVQQKSSSESTLIKLNTALDNRWKAIQESVNEDQKKNQGQWPNALAMAGGNPDIAKSLLMYAKVKNELPMTFAEAKAPTVVKINAADTTFITLPARASFQSLPAATVTPTPEESAACFYLAVTTNAGGGAMLDGEGLQQQASDVSGPEFGAAWSTSARVFTDSWGKPIAFVRQAYTDEVTTGQYVRTGQVRDPFDPGAKLAAATMTANLWSTYMANFPNWAVPTTTASAPSLLINPKTTYPGTRNFVPTLISAGPDKRYLPPDETTSTTLDRFGGSENDNILSYRLRRSGNKGD